MSQVYTFHTCPFCNSNTMNASIDTSTYEFDENCQSCGYFHYMEWDVNEDGSYKVKDNTLPEDKLYEIDNLIELGCGNDNPYGYLEVFTKDENLVENYFIKDLADFKRNIFEINNLIKNNESNYTILFSKYDTETKKIKKMRSWRNIKKLAE